MTMNARRLAVVAALWAVASPLTSPLISPPTAVADPAAILPPMISTDAGPVIGDGGNTDAVSEQLFSFENPAIQEVDGSDAAEFIAAAAGLADRDLATVFQPLRRALGCQENGAGFGARAYRRNDGLWGGGMLVIAESAVADVDALSACVKLGWRKATRGTPTSMCNSGWVYPPFISTGSGEETYFVLLAGTDSDFCAQPNANYRTTARSWPG